MKTCTKCGAPKPLTDFPKRRASKDVRGTKVTQITDMGSWGRDKVLVEIAKCDLVCANCHRLRTHATDVNVEAA